MITLPMDLEQPEVLGQVDHHEDRQGVVGDQPRQLRLGEQEANWDSEKKPTRIKSSSGDCDRSLVPSSIPKNERWPQPEQPKVNVIHCQSA